MVSKSGKHGHASAPHAKAKAAPAAPLQGACKLKPVPGDDGRFTAQVSDMPIDFALSSPDGKSQIATVRVKQGSANVPNQPTASSATAFTLNLAAGVYRVTVVVAFDEGARPVAVTEACADATRVAIIPVPAEPSGGFGLTVE